MNTEHAQTQEAGFIVSTNHSRSYAVILRWRHCLLSHSFSITPHQWTQGRRERVSYLSEMNSFHLINMTVLYYSVRVSFPPLINHSRTTDAVFLFVPDSVVSRQKLSTDTGRVRTPALSQALAAVLCGVDVRPKQKVSANSGGSE